MSDTSVQLGETVVQNLVAAGFAEPDDFVGCTSGEIRSLEQEFGVDFPTAYESCLRHIGVDSGPLFRGTEFTVESLRSQREYATKRLEEKDSEFTLAPNHFVFAGQQGHSFLFFDTEVGEDPPVHVITPDAPVEKRAESFSEWLLDRVDRYVRFESGSTNLSLE